MLFFVTLAQALELVIAQEKLSSLQQGLAASEGRVEELKKEQEGKVNGVQPVR